MKAERRHVIAPLLWLALGLGAAWVAVESAAAAGGRADHLLPLDYRTTWADVDSWNPSSGVVVMSYSILALIGLALVLLQLMRPSAPEATIHEAPGLVVTTNANGLGGYIDKRLSLTPWILRPRSRVKLKGRSVEVRTRVTPERPVQPGDEDHVVSSVRRAIEQTGLEPGDIRVMLRSTLKEQVR